MDNEKEIEIVSTAFIGRIEKLLCPTCGDRLEKATSPGGGMSFGDGRPEYRYWDFRCTNEQCNKVWRVPRALYETSWGEWPE